jgi:ribonucleoside-triphosphate reductase (formate)
MKTILITKRDGTTQLFDENKIIDAVLAAFKEVDGEITDYALAKSGNIADYIQDRAQEKQLSVEEVQDYVEHGLMATKRKDVAKEYILYREERSKQRELNTSLKRKYNQLQDLISGADEESRKENSNKDTTIVPTMRDYIAGFTCKELIDYYYSKEALAAHKAGAIHIHDTDYAPVMPMTNCCLVNLEDMLQNGTVISGTMIEKPHTFATACNIATQIITQVASSQYGGTSINMAHLAPFVQESRKTLRRKFPFLTDNQIEEFIKKEIADGVQTIQYQLITMSTTNGQAPFITVFLYLGDAKNKQEEKDLAAIIEEIFKQRIAGVKNEQGVAITTAFPKLIYALDENNIYEDSEYWYLTQLAAECSSKRLVPDYISAKVMRELKGDVYSSMGCRSFLAPDPEHHRYWGKFNQGVCTVNLPYVALESLRDKKDFFAALDEKLQLCYDVLMVKHNRLVGTKSDVAPILWQHGAFARLKSGEVIDPLLYGNNSSISLGYAGLWETVIALTGQTLLEPKGKELGLEVMQHLNDKCNEWKANTNIGFSLYGTPIESTTEKFAKALKTFDYIKGVNDKLYVTNSYHVTPAQEIDAFSKLTVESEFQKLSLGGAISYIETPNMSDNIPALLEIIKHIYNTIMYAEINTLTSYCQVCGCTDLHMGDDLKFHCPNCGNDNFDKMNIAVRVCGYISTNPFCEGRAADIHDRVYHVDSQEVSYE